MTADKRKDRAETRSSGSATANETRSTASRVAFHACSLAQRAVEKFSVSLRRIIDAPSLPAFGARLQQSKLGWYWNRLRRMSVGEIGYRGMQSIDARLQKVGLATAADVPEPNLSLRSNRFIAADVAVSAQAYVSAADLLLTGTLTIFGRRHNERDLPAWNRDPKSGVTAPLAFGKTLNYRDSSLVGDIKHLWEPNRHLQLVTLAQAYRLTGRQPYLDGLRTQLESWFDQCPYLLGPNWTSSLELAIRLINWSIVWQLIGGPDSALFAEWRGEQLRRRWLTSIYQHAHFIRGHLSRFSSANNHLIGELTGLYVAGRTWPFWPQINRWREFAKARLVREALAQNAPDGVNREQAIAYQQFVLDFMLLAALAGRANADDFPVEYWQRMERMIEFIAAVMDVRGNVPMIGDADDGYVTHLSPHGDFCPYRSLLATGAILFNRGDFKFKSRALDDKSRWLLGDAGAKKFQELKSIERGNLPRRFADGGYYIMGCDFESEREIRIVVDAGPLGYRSIAAHGHADALAFTLSLGGREFLVDPGTYAYHTHKQWRDYFRGTGAHNTIRVDGEDQSVAGGNFLWLKHASTRCVSWEEGANTDRFVGEHDGYLRLADPVKHARELLLDKAKRCLFVTDRIECKARHTIEQRWHFAEDVVVTLAHDGAINAGKDGYSVTLRPNRTVRARLCHGESTPSAGWISRRFDTKVPASTVVWTIDINESAEFSTAIECSFPEIAPARDESEEMSLT